MNILTFHLVIPVKAGSHAVDAPQKMPKRIVDDCEGMGYMLTLLIITERFKPCPMNNPPHPGLSIRHDCLEPLGLSVTAAAAHLGVSRKHLSDVIDGNSGISPEMAVRLDKAFGGGASAWYQLQAAYDLAQVMKRADRIDVNRVA